jgi:hypothetical protein
MLPLVTTVVLEAEIHLDVAKWHFKLEFFTPTHTLTDLMNNSVLAPEN